MLHKQNFITFQSHYEKRLIRWAAQSRSSAVKCTGRFLAACTAGHGLDHFFLAGHVASRPAPNTIY
ncbi:hypothetical protein BpHYR1_053272 [Brachionus plicatilis]|uniref:Uncharacterized protein n=1 Tax=Brachionus plicatilis TaxID=10195 RepID=A0A3M7T1E5_BRAPC|nr:hypothetical protein BpHYR1_053272 [Brachionus plicatilis]